MNKQIKNTSNEVTNYIKCFDIIILKFEKMSKVKNTLICLQQQQQQKNTFQRIE